MTDLRLASCAAPPGTGSGRFAPSPSGELHIGNARTAIVTWLWARTTGRRFLVRVDDLDRVKAGAAEEQLRQLRALGLTADAPPVRQSAREAAYAAAFAQLREAGRTFECYCSRKDILEAPTAPHSPPGAYPGTCRDLSEAERADRRARLADQGRTPAVRLRAERVHVVLADAVLGTVRGLVDDFVLRRGDGVWAYNLTTVVDDADMGVDQVVRGDDLASSAPRQAYVAHLLGLPVPEFAHIPLVFNDRGQRIAKRDGGATLSQLSAAGFDVWAWVGRSLGFGTWAGPDEACAEFDPARMLRTPAVFCAP